MRLVDRPPMLQCENRNKCDSQIEASRCATLRPPSNAQVGVCLCFVLPSTPPLPIQLLALEVKRRVAPRNAAQEQMSRRSRVVRTPMSSDDFFTSRGDVSYDIRRHTCRATSPRQAQDRSRQSRDRRKTGQDVPKTGPRQAPGSGTHGRRRTT